MVGINEQMFASSTAFVINSGAALDTNGTDQLVNNLSGSGLATFTIVFYFNLGMLTISRHRAASLNDFTCGPLSGSGNVPWLKENTIFGESRFTFHRQRRMLWLMDNPAETSRSRKRIVKFFTISGGTLGIVGFVFLLHSFMARPLDCGISSWMNKEERQFHQDRADIKQAGLVLFVHAKDNNGKYPDDLGVFLKTELLNPSFYRDDEIQQSKRLFYKKDGRQFRWIYTPGLTINDNPRSILLLAADRYKTGGLFFCTNGTYVQYTKNPDRDIIIVNGKPMLRDD